MIAYVEGTLAEKTPARVVLDVGGVGYEVFIPLSTYDRLPATGERCRLVTYDHVREDARQLFGFGTPAERDMFLMLLGVSGIGPRLALTTLSGLSVREIKAAIVQGDTRRLSSISGIGRKTAERIVVDLKDKIGAGEALEAVSGTGVEMDDHRLRDALAALVALGYRQEQAAKALAQVVKSDAARTASVEELIRAALSAT